MSPSSPQDTSSTQDLSSAQEGPRYPEITVHLTEQAGAPVAMVALVRRTLQKAGHHAAATEFTNLGLAAAEDEIIALAQRFVQVE